MKKTLYEWCKENNKDYLLDEWDYEKNNAIGLFVDKISYGSGRVANWICEKGHKYERRIDARTSKTTKCPYCSNRELLKGFNDLPTTHPELMEEWDYEKNTGIDPYSIMSLSSLEVWWKCKECNSSWNARVRYRTKLKHGCPYCAHLLPIVGKTDLKSQYPEIAEEWDYENNAKGPEEYTAYSGIKVSWICKYCGKKWKSAINNRTSGMHNCPHCTMKSTSFGEQAVYYYVKKIFNDAINRYRYNNKIELDIYIPSIKTAIEFDGLRWHNDEKSFERDRKKYNKCRENGIKLIRIRDSNAKKVDNVCDSSFGIENLQDVTQLQNIIRLILRELDPQSHFLTRKKTYQFWSTIDKEINPEKDRFKILEGKYQKVIKDSFVHQCPDLYREWNFEKNCSLNPLAFSKASTIKVWWKCSVCDHEWEARIVDRTLGTNKCPVCTNKVLKVGVNDFATRYPELLEEWDYERNNVKPNEILMRSLIKVYWKCKKCNNSWVATLGDRTRKDKPSGCPKCKYTSMAEILHEKALKKRSLAQTHPKFLEEWDYEKNNIAPTEITSGSNKLVWWKCKFCGHSRLLSPNNRIRKRSKCPKCKKRI